MDTQKRSVQKVVALEYRPEVGIPVVTYKAAGVNAAKLLENSLRQNSIPLVRNEKLLEQLFKLPLNSTIDPKLFQVVATILVHIFSINQTDQDPHNV